MFIEKRAEAFFLKKKQLKVVDIKVIEKKIIFGAIILSELKQTYRDFHETYFLQ